MFCILMLNLFITCPYIISLNNLNVILFEDIRKDHLTIKGKTPLSTIFQLYNGAQFYLGRKWEYPEKTTDLSEVVNPTIIRSGSTRKGELLKFEEKYCRFFILKNLILVSCKIKYLSEGKHTLCRLRKS